MLEKKKIICSNCGKPNHKSKQCIEPIVSYGLINIRILGGSQINYDIIKHFNTQSYPYYYIKSKKYTSVYCCVMDNIKIYEDFCEKYDKYNHIPYQKEEDLKKFWFFKDKIQFMMISRHFSLGFIDFIKGNYEINDQESISRLFELMSQEEINFIKDNQYDDILYHLMNRNHEEKEIVLNRIYKGNYGAEYLNSKNKFQMLQNKPDHGLLFYVENIKPKWKMVEWGFPKGRKDKYVEEDLKCACREFEEETGYHSDEYVILNKIAPIEEKLIGTNGVYYRHIYFISLNKSLIINETEKPTNRNYDSYEVGDIQWFTYEEAINHIRPYHHDKKNILTKVYLFILNFLINL
jgi:8-oxo-dGTP pyrophosphatase MutT (NUDIX family)